MRRARSLAACLVVGAALCGAGCRSEPARPTRGVGQDASVAVGSRLGVFAPLPARVAREGEGGNEEAVALGRMLFFEPRLSRSQTIACASCHDLAHYGGDGQAVSDGYRGRLGTRNAPSVFNAAAQFSQFWDGRAVDVEDQVRMPVLDPVEMAMPGPEAAVAVLRSMPEYVARFGRAFPGDADPITFDHLARAIGAFERRLMTPSRWDALLGGDRSALTSSELAGLQAFLDAGCQACHNGALLGGTSYQKLGLAMPYPGLTDPGRFAVTGVEGDRGVFKVPPLRNVERTAPYFHDGKVATLDQAVRLMARHELGKDLPAGQVQQVVEFLKALTGQIDTALFKPPPLPRSTRATPRPDVP
jgi:cytochrome c peroxidase